MIATSRVGASPPFAGSELWLVDLATCAGALAELESRNPRLPAEFRPRDETHRLAHIALRLLLARAGAEKPAAPFSISDIGKPSLPGGPAFNLSHTGRHALVGIASEGAIGVDLERRGRAIRMAPDRAERIRIAGSHVAPDAGPLTADDDGTLQAWVRLEASAKAEGIGITLMLGRHGVLGTGSRPAPSLNSGPPLRVTDLDLGPDLFGAVATAGRGPPPAPLSLPATHAELSLLLGA